MNDFKILVDAKSIHIINYKPIHINNAARKSHHITIISK